VRDVWDIIWRNSVQIRRITSNNEGQGRDHLQSTSDHDVRHSSGIEMLHSTWLPTHRGNSKRMTLIMDCTATALSACVLRAVQVVIADSGGHRQTNAFAESDSHAERCACCNTKHS